MKSLQEIILEKLKIKKSNYNYKYFPETRVELRKIIKERIENEGNDVDLNDIDVSEITNMDALFYSKYLCDFCGDVSKWDVSNVTSMNHTFCGCKKFNCNLSEWNTENVTDMHSMFFECHAFEGKGLETWNVTNVENMESLFGYCYKFTGKEVEGWDMQNVVNMIDMFYGCNNLKCNLDSWKTRLKKIESWNDMFEGCYKMKLPTWYKL